jgi:hypothetical protein
MKPPSHPDKSEPAASPASGADSGSSGSSCGDDHKASPTAPVREIGGRRDGTDPTRFGDWEKGGRCIDF